MSLSVLWSRQPLAALGKLTAAALLGAALAFAILWLTILLAGSFILPLFIVAAALLVVAGIVASGVRWTPLLGAFVGLGTIIVRTMQANDQHNVPTPSVSLEGLTLHVADVEHAFVL